MANLIIKPTSGGSLILQDEGGDAALTVGTTGVSTIADATITAGTFPTGHILNIVWGSTIAAQTLTSGTTVIATKTFTPTSRTNKLFVECLATFQLYGNSSTANPSFNIQIFHNGTLIDTVHDVHNNNVGSQTAHNFVQTLTRDLIDVDHASASGSRAVEMKAEHASGRYYTDANWYGHRITIWEIA